MNIEIDTHTHTVLSGHAHSTLIENAAWAKKAGLKGFVVTDHGPAIPAAPPDFNLSTLEYLPASIDGVRVYHGVEANIVDFDSRLDIREKYLKIIDFAIAGLHEVVLRPGGKKKDTDAVLGALQNKHIDIIAHPDNPSYSLDYEAVVKEVARQNKLMEVNDHSFEYRQGGIANALVYLPLCARHGVRVAVSSDAHSAFGMGKFDVALRVLEQLRFPAELIINATGARFEAYLEERSRRQACCAG
jgi:putative hydrolase